MKDIYYKKGRYLATIILILTVLIFGSVKLDYLNVQAESMDQGDENKLLEISQGDFMHRFVRGSEGLTFQLDVKDPELDVQYDWQILVPPMHGGATVFEEGTSIDVSYMPAENFFGEDNFLVEVSTTTGTRSKINVAVTVAPGEAQTEMENLRKPEGGEIALSPSFELEQKYPGDMAPERDRMDKPGVWKPNRYEDSDPRQDELDVLRDLDKKAQFDDNYRSAGIDGERSDPYFQVYPEWDEIDGYDWTPSTSVTLTIDSTVVATKESNDYGDVYFYLDPFDVLLGHVIEMTDGTYTRTHTVTSLTVTDIDEAADTISGTAEDGSEISVSANDDNGGDYLYPIADSFDNWSADFSGLVDIASGAYGYARQYDAEGNSTNIRWYIPDPYIEVYTSFDNIHGYDWLPNTPISLTIGVQEWIEESDSSGWVYFYTSPFDITSGQAVEMTDGTYTRTYTVTNLTVTDIDEIADTISGTAEAGSEISVSAHDDNGGDYLYPIADSFDNWSADFSGLVDIASGAFGYASQYDGEGNSTRVYWDVPDPYIKVYPEGDTVFGDVWTPDTTITLTIGTQEWIEESNEGGWVWFNISPFDITAGQVVEMTDGTYTRTHTVTNLTVTDVNEAADSVSGTAEPGSDVYVDGWDDWDYDYLTVTAEPSGDWTAAFTYLDVAPGASGDASQYDAEGNSTNIYWFVADPIFQVYPLGDYIYGYEWTPDTMVTATVGASTIGSGWSDGVGDVYFSAFFDLQPFDEVVLSDGTYTRTHVVKDIHVTEINQTSDMVFGTAEPLSELSHVSAYDGDDWSYRYPVADGSGNWSADFTGMIDIVPGSSGWAVQDDEARNETCIRWFVPDPYMRIYPEDDRVYGYAWPPDTTITLNIDGTEWIGVSSYSGWVMFYDETFDVQVGQTVTMLDGTFTQVHNVRPLSVTTIDDVNDTLSGTAKANDPVDVSACYYGCSNLTVTADGSGNWTADFNGIEDIEQGYSGSVIQYDPDGDSTRISWRLRDPAFEVHPGDNYIFGWDWSPNMPVTLEINSVLIATEESDPMGYVGFFPESFDIQPGQEIVLSDGTYTKTHTVIDLAVTTIDEVNDILNGTANPGTLTVDAYDAYNWETLYPVADTNGVWTVNFNTVDIAEGTSASIYQSDEDNDLTFIYWLIPDPKISERPQDDVVYGYSWPQNTEITLTIEYTRETLVEVETSNEHGSVYFFLDSFDLQPGDIVTMTAGTYTQEHIVRDISVTEIDQVLDTVSGTAEPGSEVQVCAYFYDGYYYTGACIITTADGSGIWQANFSGSVDIMAGSWGGVYQYDENNNYTYIYWEVSDEGYQIFLPLIVH